MRASINDISLLIVDVQERLFPLINSSETLEKKMNNLISGFKVLDLPILITEQYKKGLGATIPSIIENLGELYVSPDKLVFSCFGCDEFVKNLESNGRKQIVLIGIESHVCVLQTALDGIERGYNVIIPEDCVGSRNTNDKLMAIERLRQLGAIITTYESLLMELIKASSHDKFKEISKIIK